MRLDPRHRPGRSIAYEIVRRYGLKVQQRKVGEELAAQARKSDKAEASA
ncbi:hypothetical protein [Streptomyces cinnamoneus]